MTRKAEYTEKCDRCGSDMVCRNCKLPKKTGTKFSKWLRELRGDLSSSNFSNQNLDYIWYNYKQNWLITIEEKTNGGKCSDSQLSVHNMIRQMLEFSSGKFFEYSFRGNKILVRVYYYGHYIIQFEKTNPDDSKWIKINSIECTKQDLIILLSTGVFIRDVNNEKAKHLF